MDKQDQVNRMGEHFLNMMTNCSQMLERARKPFPRCGKKSWQVGDKMEPYKFVPLYYGDRLKIVNDYGDIAIVTCWSDPSKVLTDLLAIWDESELDRIACVGRLYGNGLPELLRNLLYNPQIKHLYVCGTDLSGSLGDVVNFFSKGVTEVEVNGVKMYQIVGRMRRLDTLVHPNMLNAKLWDPAAEDLPPPYTKSFPNGGVPAYTPCIC